MEIISEFLFFNWLTDLKRWIWYDLRYFTFMVEYLHVLIWSPLFYLYGWISPCFDMISVILPSLSNISMFWYDLRYFTFIVEYLHVLIWSPVWRLILITRLEATPSSSSFFSPWNLNLLIYRLIDWFID